MRAQRSILAFTAIVVSTACAAPSAPTNTRIITAGARTTGGTESGVLGAAPTSGPPHWTVTVAPGDAIPVTDQDPVWGDPDAPVTIVAFEDFDCVHCAKSSETLGSLMHRYGPHDLRIVFKHDPLPMHSGAREAADLGAAIFQVGGTEAFFAYTKTVFGELIEKPNLPFTQVTGDGLASAQAVASMSVPEIQRRMSTTGAQKVDEDLALARAVGAKGTPMFFVNGVAIRGAEMEDVFETVIDDELKQAKGGNQRGGRSDVYAQRLAANVAAGRANPNAEPPKKAEPLDPVLHFVPIDGAPVLGRSTALVTIVEFADFDCTECQGAAVTLRAIAKKYGDKVRIVFKPIAVSSHPRSEPASELAMAIFKRKGDAAFWKAYDSLYDPSVTLDDASLERHANKAGLDGKATLAEIGARKYATALELNLDLADDLQIAASPQFFVNGKRLRGNPPMDTFTAVVDAELESARALVDRGMPPPQVYDAIMKDADRPPPPATKQAPAVTGASPSRGPASAPVTIQIFGDFQCPYCKKFQPVLAQIERDFSGQVRIVFRELPHQGHKDALPAATAAVEAYRQKGDAAFWAFHDALYSAQGTSPDALKRPALEKMAADLGLDMKAFGAALDAPDPPTVISDDLKLATDLDIRGTPTVFINDYVIVGAQPVRQYERLIRRALTESAPALSAKP